MWYSYKQEADRRECLLQTELKTEQEANLMKKFLTLALALVLVIGCVANASALTIGFSQVGQESDWRTANTDSLKAMAEKEGWTMVYDDAQQKQENQIAALRSFITQGVDYILFTGVVNTGF